MFRNWSNSNSKNASVTRLIIIFHPIKRTNYEGIITRFPAEEETKGDIKCSPRHLQGDDRRSDCVVESSNPNKYNGNLRHSNIGQFLID